MKKHLLCLLGVLFAWPVTAQPVLHLSLNQCQIDALASSPQLKQLQAQADAAQSTYQASRAVFYPTLTLDAQGSWVSEVPSLTLGPMEMEFGDNWGYSAGPTLRYVLFDAGQRSGQSKSAQAAASAQAQQAAFARKQVLLQVRQAYITVQNDLERLYFLDGQLAVARKQLNDVQASFKAGAKSRLDVYMAQKQVSQAQADIAGARGALSAHLRELFRLTGTQYAADPRFPNDQRLQQSQTGGQTSVWLLADSQADTLKAFAPFAKETFDENSPRLAALENMSQYYEYLAQSYRAALYPRVSLQGGAYFEYPNGPIKEHIFAGKASAGLSIPLFEGSKDRKQAQAQQHSAQAARYEKQDARQTLEKLFYSAQDGLYALSVQEQFVRQMIEQAEQTAALTYQAYLAGAATFFDVDRANLERLKSQLALADLHAQQLNNLAVLDSLGKEDL